MSGGGLSQQAVLVADRLDPNFAPGAVSAFRTRKRVRDRRALTAPCVVGRSPGAVLHDEALARARPESDVARVERGTERGAGVASRRLDVNISSTSVRSNSLPLASEFIAQPPASARRSSRSGSAARARGRRSAPRRRAGARPRGPCGCCVSSSSGRRARPEQLVERRGEDAPELRRAVVPGHVDAFARDGGSSAGRARNVPSRRAGTTRAAAARRSAARRRPRGPSPCTRRRSRGSRGTG